jgi:hypothetical protein
LTEDWSCDNFQPEIGFLGSEDRQYIKKNIHLKFATFEELFLMFSWSKKHSIQFFFTL